MAEISRLYQHTPPARPLLLPGNPIDSLLSTHLQEQRIMPDGLTAATLPIVALGCSIYAVWSLYGTWKTRHCQSDAEHRRPVHPISAAIQTGLSVVLCVALLMTGLSIFGKTARQSPYARWLKCSAAGSGENDAPGIERLKDLPGAFEIARLDPAQPVVGVSLTNLPSGNRDVARLADRCPEIEWLHLQNTLITDSGLASLHRFQDLRMVVLSSTAISDRGLEQLAQIRTLEVLYLCDTEISDDGLAYLEDLLSLKNLDLSRTKVTRRAVRKLRTRLPECSIRFRKRA